MFETVHLNARTGRNGHLRVDLPTGLPADREVALVVSMMSTEEFEIDDWQAHVDSVFGSLPDFEQEALPRRHRTDGYTLRVPQTITLPRFAPSYLP